MKFFFTNGINDTFLRRHLPRLGRNCGSRRVARSSVESVEPNVWLGTDHQKFQRSKKKHKEVHSPCPNISCMVYYAYLHLPWKNQPLIQIYIYIYIPSPLGHQYTQEHPHCVGGETLICLGDSNPDFIFIWNQKLWRYYWWKNKWNYFSVLEHYDDILCMKQFQLKKTCSNRYHFGSTSLIFFSKPLTTRPRWPSLMTNTMTADPRTQWCGVCRSMFFWCGLMNRKQQKTGGFFQVWRWNEVYEQGIDFCWEIFVCKFNTCSWRLQVRRFGTGWTMHFDEDVVSTIGDKYFEISPPFPH